MQREDTSGFACMRISRYMNVIIAVITAVRFCFLQLRFLPLEHSIALSCVVFLLNSFDFCVCSICVILLVLKLAITFLLLLQPFGLFFLSQS